MPGCGSRAPGVTGRRRSGPGTSRTRAAPRPARPTPQPDRHCPSPHRTSRAFPLRTGWPSVRPRGAVSRHARPGRAQERAPGLGAELVRRDDRQREAVLVGGPTPRSGPPSSQGLGLGVGVARDHDRLDHRVPAQERARGRDHICGGVQQCGGRTGRRSGAGLHGADQRLGVRRRRRSGQSARTSRRGSVAAPSAKSASIRPRRFTLTGRARSIRWISRDASAGPPAPRRSAEIAEVQPGGAVALLGPGFDHRPQGADPFADRLQACTGQRLVGRREGIAGQGRKRRPGHAAGRGRSGAEAAAPTSRSRAPGTRPRARATRPRARATRRRAQAKRPRARATRRRAREGQALTASGRPPCAVGCCRRGRRTTRETRSGGRSAVGEASSAPPRVELSTGLTGSGSGSGSVLRAPLFSVLVRHDSFPGLGADSDQPSHPASTSWAWSRRAGHATVGTILPGERGPLQEADVRARVQHLTRPRRPPRRAVVGAGSARRGTRRPRPRTGSLARPARGAGPAAVPAIRRRPGGSVVQPLVQLGSVHRRATASPAARSVGGRLCLDHRCSPLRQSRGTVRTYCSSLSPAASGSRSSTREALLVTDAQQRPRSSPRPADVAVKSPRPPRTRSMAARLHGVLQPRSRSMAWTGRRRSRAPRSSTCRSTRVRAGAAAGTGHRASPRGLVEVWLGLGEGEGRLSVGRSVAAGRCSSARW